jgi:hypothetical protein
MPIGIMWRTMLTGMRITTLRVTTSDRTVTAAAMVAAAARFGFRPFGLAKQALDILFGHRIISPAGFI